MALLVCSCGDCKHWEIKRDSVICLSCGKEFKATGIGLAMDSHVTQHPELSWAEEK